MWDKLKIKLSERTNDCLCLFSFNLMTFSLIELSISYWRNYIVHFMYQDLKIALIPSPGFIEITVPSQIFQSKFNNL